MYKHPLPAGSIRPPLHPLPTPDIHRTSKPSTVCISSGPTLPTNAPPLSFETHLLPARSQRRVYCASARLRMDKITLPISVLSRYNCVSRTFLRELRRCLHHMANPIYFTNLVERGEEPGHHGIAESQRTGEKLVRGLLGSTKYFLRA